MRQFACLLVVLVSVVAAAPALQAATITWANQYVAEGATMYDALSTDGALVEAQNLGGGAISVTSDSTEIPFAAGTWVFPDYPANFGAYFSGSDNLLDSAIFSGDTSETFPLSGLSSGQSYLVQLIMVDNRGGTKTVSVDGGDAVQYSSSAGGYLLFTGTFTADAATQDIDLVSAPVGGSTVTVNGFQVRAVPEPGTMALLTAGLLGLLAYAWRKRK